jgi:transcriptional regulator with XRE-family HTH domain
MDRRETVSLFRQRLREVIGRTGESRSAFARRVGLDRSTLSQLLDEDALRLPRAETIVAIASTGQVSVDWLLGLSQEGQLGPELVPRALEIEPGAGAPADERLLAWHQEAAGYRIRYVPSGIPDLLKTEELIRYEYSSFATEVSAGRIGQAMTRLAYMRRPEADFEMACSLQSVETFARGELFWRGLDWPARRQQLEQMARICAELYPALRWFLFDGLKRFSVPYTLFGPQRAAVYFGNMYFVFNSTEHLRILARHFDDLVRAAIVQPPDVPREIERMIRENEPTSAGGQRRLARQAGGREERRKAT